MQTFTIRNMQYVIGPDRQRRPIRIPVPNSSNPPGLGSIQGAPDQLLGTLTPSTKVTSLLPSPIYQDGKTTLYFAFTSLVGCIGGGQVTNVISSPLSGTVGNDPIVQLNVYVPHGGNGPGGGNGAIIDAFNETSGSFVDDIFVTLSPDTNGSLTTSANDKGYFSTANAAEVVSAKTYISPTRADFVKWLFIADTKGSSDFIDEPNKKYDLHTGRNSNVIAFAYYAEQEGKERFKEILDNLQLKYVGEFMPIGPIEKGDPYNIIILQGLYKKIETLERKFGEMGNAFIKQVDRPEVGKDVAKKANKRK